MFPVDDSVCLKRLMKGLASTVSDSKLFHYLLLFQ